MTRESRLTANGAQSGDKSTSPAFELTTVLMVAFFTALVGNLVFALTDSATWRHQFSWSVGNGALKQVPAILLVWYVIRTQGAKRADFGIVFRWSTLLSAIAVFIVVWVLDGLALELVGQAERTSSEEANSYQVFVSQTPIAFSMAFVVLAAAKEDLVARAYLITRAEQLGMGKWTGVGVSVLLLALCHLYQGPVVALAKVPGSLALSVFFVWRRDITAIVLAHVAYNALALY